MPLTAEELVELLDLETIDLNLFRGQQPQTTLQRSYGGQVAAQALVAAYRTAPQGMVAHSLHAYFLRPGDTSAAIVYDVDPIREGRTFATRRVLARQNGRPIFTTTVNFQTPEDGFEHQDVMPVVPDPQDCVDVGELFRREDNPRQREWQTDWGVIDLRLVGDTRPAGALLNDEYPALARYWVRIKGEVPGDLPMQQCALTYLSDLTLLGASLTAHDRIVGEPDLVVASLDHAVWFHRPFRADEWLLYDQHSPTAAGARGFSIGRLFTQDGRLVASAAQEGLIRQTRRR